MKIHIPKIKQVSAVRPAGYFDDVMSSGVVDGDYLLIAPDAYQTLLKKYSPAKSLAEAGNCCKPAKAKRVEYPPLTQQAKNVAKAGLGIAGAVFAGKKVRRSEADKERVMTICKSQTDGCYDADSERCRKCGCKLGMALVGKWDWETEKCPKGLW